MVFMPFGIDLNKTFRSVDRQVAEFMIGEEEIKSFQAIKIIKKIAIGCLAVSSASIAGSAITGLIAGAVISPVLSLITAVALGILAHDAYKIVENQHERFTRATGLISTIYSQTPSIHDSDFKGTVLSHFPIAQKIAKEAIIKLTPSLQS